MNINPINNTNFSGTKGLCTLHSDFKNGNSVALKIVKDVQERKIHMIDYALCKKNADTTFFQGGGRIASSRGFNKQELNSFFEQIKASTKENIDFLIDFAKVICSK